MAVLFTLVTLALMSFSTAENAGQQKESNYTVTDEVWFEIEIKDFPEEGDDYRERFTIALFGKTCPMTVLNFRSLVMGYSKSKKKLHYLNSRIHRIVPDFIIQMGDITTGDGTGGESMFGPIFDDENFIISHKAAGYVSMANHGPNSNGSQFFITLNKARWLDGKHVVFGKVVNGMDVVKTIGEVPANKQTALPRKKITIVGCGMNTNFEPYTMTKQQTESDGDL